MVKKQPKETEAGKSSVPVTDAAPVKGAANKAAAGTVTGGNSQKPVMIEYQPRQVKLVVSRVDPWSVMKVTFLLSVCFGVAVVFGSALVWLILNLMGVFAHLKEFVTEIDPTGAVSTVIDYIQLPRVLAFTTIISVMNVVISTALSTIGAALYNLAAALVGGIHVSLSDD